MNELWELEQWAVASEARQDEIARTVLRGLPGWDWAGSTVYPLPGSRDDASLVRIVSLREAATGFVFQLIPGVSSFPIGLSDEEEARLRRQAEAAFSPDSDDRLPAFSGRSHNKPVRRVTIRPFLLMRDPVTAQQAARLLNIPLEEAYMEMLEVAGFESDEVEQMLAITGHSLPSEAQWEYACRGGIPGRLFPWGDSFSRGDEWLETYEDSDTPPVRKENPHALNRFGLSGMGAWMELCADIYQDGYNEAPPDDRPRLDPPADGDEPLHVLRGGGALSYPWQGVGEWAWMLCGERVDEGAAMIGFNLRLARLLPGD